MEEEKERFGEVEAAFLCRVTASVRDFPITLDARWAEGKNKKRSACTASCPVVIIFIGQRNMVCIFAWSSQNAYTYLYLSCGFSMDAKYNIDTPRVECVHAQDLGQ